MKTKTQHRKKDNLNHKDYLETRNKSEEDNSGCKSDFVDNHCAGNKIFKECEDCWECNDFPEGICCSLCIERGKPEPY